MAEATTPDWLERANRLALTGALLSTTVHEVNNALQVITGSAEMLGPTAPPDVIARRTEAISAHARRASALLAELSSFAKDDSVNALALDLAQTAHRALSMRQYTIARLKLESSFESRGEVRTVIANARGLLQIVLNLVVNAEQALAQKGAGRIALTLDNAGGQVTLAVEDDGPGIDSGNVPRLFVPGAVPSYGRLGIGLAVAKQLAEKYGGSLDYSSRTGGGCRFTLSLPEAR